MNLNLFKEGFDTLPTAVCFFDSRGIVRLVNEKMIEIGNLFLDNNIQTLEEFKDALEGPCYGIKKKKEIFHYMNYQMVNSFVFIFQKLKQRVIPFIQKLVQ